MYTRAHTCYHPAVNLCGPKCITDRRD